MSMVGLVLLIACGNLASLLVARGEARQREIAVRQALVAGRRRLIWQLLTESLLIALAGGGAGLALAAWMLKALVGAVPEGLGVAGLEAKLDPRVLAFAAGLSILTGILFGLAPALRATHGEPQTTLKDQGTSVFGSVSSVRLRRCLLVSQVSLTAVLLVGAGLFARSLINLRSSNLGLRTDHVIEFSVSPGLSRYAPQQTIALLNPIRQGITTLPGVQSASAAAIPVFTDSDSGSDITVEGHAPHENESMHIFKN